MEQRGELSHREDWLGIAPSEPVQRPFVTFARLRHRTEVLTATLREPRKQLPYFLLAL